MLAYSIAIAEAVPAIDRCVVSTDDAETAAIARSYGAEVVERPAELATDTASTGSVIQHALACLSVDGSRDTVITLQPCCPLRPADLVSDALELFERRECDSVVSVTQSHQKTGQIVADLFVPAYQPGIRSQDLPSLYFENGLVYVSGAAQVRQRGDLFGRQVRPLVTDPLYALGDIDTELDFRVAEFLFQQHRQRFPVPRARRS